MSRALSGGEASPLRLVIPDSPEVFAFLVERYANENPEMVVGSAATLRDYKTQVRTLQKFFDWENAQRGEVSRAIAISDISKQLLNRAVAWLHKVCGRKATTCNKFRRTIQAIYNFAVDECELPGQLLRAVKLPEIARDPRAWYPEEVTKIIGAARSMPRTKRGEWDGQDDYALVLFLLNTGTRITATMRTPKSLLDRAKGGVMVPGEIQKHGSDESFDLLDITIDALKQMHMLPNSPLLFDHWRYDDWVNGKWRALTERLKRILVKAGLFKSVKEVSGTDLFHKFRKTFATFIRMTHGKDAAKELCGHSSGTVTDRYIDKRQTGDRPSCRAALQNKIKLPDPQQPLFNKEDGEA